MNILEMGLEKRISEVAQLSSEDVAVLNSQELYDRHFRELTEKIGRCELLFAIEDAVNRLRFAELDAGYRIGIADGLQLQCEINNLIKEGANKHG